MNSPGAQAEVVSRRRPVLGHWPSVVGLAAATFQIVTGVTTDAVAITLAVATSCYLAAAALGLRWIAWAGVLTGTIVVILSEIAGIAWWAGLAIYAAILVLVGLQRQTPVRPLTTQASRCSGSAAWPWSPCWSRHA